MMIESEVQFLKVGSGADVRKIAVRHLASSTLPGLFWLSGYRSDMLGSKAEAINDYARQKGLACCRMDYSGHGSSEGDFRQGTISRWLEESLAVFDRFTTGPQLVIGSSMGGWIALKLAEALNKRGQGERLHAMVLIAPAPDFTHELLLPQLGEREKSQLRDLGYFEEPSTYSDDPNIFTRALIEDGEKNLVLNGNLETGCPVHILQGMNDKDVPWQHAIKLSENMGNTDLTMTLVRDGDHRLSRPQDIERMIAIVDRLVGARN